MLPLPGLLPGSPPGGERGVSVLCSSRGVPAAPPGLQNSVHGSFGLTCGSFSPRMCTHPQGLWIRMTQAAANLHSFRSLASCCQPLILFGS